MKYLRQDIFEKIKGYLPVYSQNYFNRAICQNELFFVCSIEKLQNYYSLSKIVNANLSSIRLKYIQKND